MQMNAKLSGETSGMLIPEFLGDSSGIRTKTEALETAISSYFSMKFAMSGIAMFYYPCSAA